MGFGGTGRGWAARVALGLCGAAALGVAAAGGGTAARGTGTLEICKAADDGAAGQSFSFTATSGSDAAGAAVVAGTCSFMNVPPGNWTIVEDVSSGLWQMAHVAVVPTSAWLSENDRAGKVRVAVAAGQDTQVTVTNQQAAAVVKVCKWSSSPSLQGKQFTFTVAGQAVTAVAGKTAGSAGCSTAITTQTGSRLKIAEAVPAGVAVAGITAGANTTLTTPSAGVARVTAGPAVNVVTFEDEPVGPPQTGFIEICKDAGDAYISPTDAFTFTVGDGAGASDTEQVFAGQCTRPLKVAAGTVSVSEAPTDGVSVTGISTLPDPAALGQTNLVNGTATVVVPVSADPGGEVQVHFVNSTQTATLKICKVLTAASGDLAGKTFRFDIASRSVTDVDSLSIVAGSGASGACKNLPVQLPVGSTATVTEEPVENVGANGGDAGAGATRTITIAPGIDTVTFTNEAYGQLEICKNMQRRPTDDTPWNGTVFHFTVDGGKPAVDVAAGACSAPLTVPAGSHLVKEVRIPYGFGFVSSSATGPLGDNRGDGGDNPITVTVPYLPSGGETEVTFVDRVLRATLKICKVIDPHSQAALGGSTFSFFYDVANDAGGFADVVDVPAGTCTGLIGGPLADGFPIVDTDGSATLVFVGEGFNGGYHVTSITLSGGTFDPTFDPNPDPVCGSAFIDPGPGPNVVTFTNASGDVDETRCFSE